MSFFIANFAALSSWSKLIIYTYSFFFLLSFSLLGAFFSFVLRHNGYIAPSAKTEICIPIEEKYS